MKSLQSPGNIRTDDIAIRPAGWWNPTDRFWIAAIEDNKMRIGL